MNVARKNRYCRRNETHPIANLKSGQAADGGSGRSYRPSGDRLSKKPKTQRPDSASESEPTPTHISRIAELPTAVAVETIVVTGTALHPLVGEVRERAPGIGPRASRRENNDPNYPLTILLVFCQIWQISYQNSQFLAELRLETGGGCLDNIRVPKPTSR